MSADLKDDDVDETPEYPLPSPTDPLSRDQRPPDDEDDAGAESKEGKFKAQQNVGLFNRVY